MQLKKIEEMKRLREQAMREREVQEQRKLALQQEIDERRERFAENRELNMQ